MDFSKCGRRLKICGTMHWNGLNNFGRRPHRHHIPVKFGQNPEEDVQVKMLTDDARRTTDKGLSQ